MLSPFSPAAQFTACVFLFTFDVCMPPAALPNAKMDGDTLGTMPLLTPIWKQSVYVQFAAAVALAAFALLPWRLCVGAEWAHASSTGEHRVWTLAAVVLSVGGQALRQWSKVVLGRFFTYQLTEPTALVADGPYALLLHPGYTGVILSLVGVYMQMFTAFTWRVAIVAVCFAGVVGPIRLRIVEEEAMLARVFGAAWDAFTATRWHLFPGVW
jgi:protein-S-isoprenylcysteine O-methyltransferase Ste14